MYKFLSRYAYAYQLVVMSADAAEFSVTDKLGWSTGT